MPSHADRKCPSNEKGSTIRGAQKHEGSRVGSIAARTGLFVRLHRQRAPLHSHFRGVRAGFSLSSATPGALGYFSGENWAQIAESIHHSFSTPRLRCDRGAVYLSASTEGENGINPTIMAFMAKLVGDLGAMASIGPMSWAKTRTVQAMANGASMTPADLAEITGTHERYVREWLCAQAASGFVEYDPATAFSMTEDRPPPGRRREPVLFLGAVDVAVAMRGMSRRYWRPFAAERVWAGTSTTLVFSANRSVSSVPAICGTCSAMIPALDGVKGKLEAGATVADVGCGHGASTILMAQGVPQEPLYGFDYHGPSIERAGIGGRGRRLGPVHLRCSRPRRLPRRRLWLVAFFDCLHDMGDPRAPPATSTRPLPTMAHGW